MQKMILLGLVLLALVGPLVRYIGALKILIGVLGVSVSYLAATFLFLGKVLIGLPIMIVRRMFLLLMDTMLLLVPEAWATTGGITGAWTALAAFFALWNRVVAQIFMAGNLTITKIWIAEGLLRIAIIRAQLITQLNLFKVFFLKLQLQWVLLTLAGATKWGAMWIILKNLTIAGMLTQFAWFSKFMAVTQYISMVAGAITAVWIEMWSMVHAISAAGWALLRAEWLISGLGVVGIWAMVQGLLGSVTAAGEAAILVVTEAWSVTMGAIWLKLGVYLKGLWIATWAQVRAISVLAAVGEIGIFSAMWQMFKVIAANGAVALATIIGGLWTGITTFTSLVFARLVAITALGEGLMTSITAVWSVSMGAIFEKLGVYLKGLWIVTWARIRVISLMASLGEIGIFSAMWQGIKIVSANAAVAIVTIVGGMWRGLVVISQFAAIGLAGITGKMWRAMLLITEAGTVSMKLLFIRMRAVLAVIWTTTAALSSTIWKGMALSMVMFSRAGILGVVNVFKMLIPFLLRFARFATGPWGILIAAVTGLLYAFRDQIKQIFENIVAYVQQNMSGVGRLFDWLGKKIESVFNLLPDSVQNAMIAVVQTVEAAAKAVYGWFSYLNPFASHSPSLVDNVTKGMGEVNKQFATLSNIKKYTDAAYAEIARFGRLTAGLNLNAAKAQQKEDRKTIAKAPGGGAALGSYDKLTGMLNKLSPILDRLNAKMQAQQHIVDSWQAKVDKANDALGVQQKKLDSLQGTLDKYNNKLSDAQSQLSNYASAPLVGMQDMNDKIEANTVAQNKLKLAMMDMENTVGPLGDVKTALDKINGAQEMLRGKRADLAAGGAGSDILKTYDDQISALEKQKKTYQSTGNAINDMQAQLDALGRQADRLDLVKSLKFDDLNYQIQKAANTMKEMPFDEIMKGVKNAQSDIKKYSDKVDTASAAVKRQQAVVDGLTAARDRLQTHLDAEQKVLDGVTAKYNEVNDAIQAINDSLNNVLQSANKVADAAKKAKGGSLSPGLENFRGGREVQLPGPRWTRYWPEEELEVSGR